MFRDVGFYHRLKCQNKNINGEIACFVYNTKFVSAFLQDLHKVEAKLQEKQLREKEEEERQRRITAQLKEKVRVVW